MAYQTSEEIRTSIADLTERLRQIRVEQGLPAEPRPRPKFVDIPLTMALIDRLEQFKAIVIRYANILAQGQFTRIDIDKLAKYRQYAELLSYSAGFFSGIYGTGARAALACMERINQAIEDGRTDMLSATEEARHLHYDIGFMSKDTGLRSDAYDYQMKTGESPDDMDEAAFQSALAEAIAKLPNKEEELSYE